MAGLSLRTKLVSFIIGFVTLVQMAWGLSVVSSDTELLEREAHRRGRAVLQAIAAPASLRLANREIETLDAILATYLKRTSGSLTFRSIAILDMNGIVVSHTDPRRFGQHFVDPFTRRALLSHRPLEEVVEEENGRWARMSVPIISGLRWGTITAELSLQGVDERAEQARLMTLISSTIISICTAIIIGIVLHRTIFVPMGQLTRTSRQITEGDFSARVVMGERGDEMALLGSTFNEMAGRVQRNTVELETQVRVRTTELRAANTALERANEDLAQAVDELERLASTDGLTQLNNHRAFQETIASEVLRSVRTQQPLTMLMIDVDHFKSYNDTHGHPAGDKVLVQVARILERTLRTTDVVARYGGEEFAVILIETPLSSGAQVADKIRNAVRQQAFPGARESQPSGRITVSIGMAGWPMHGDSAADLIKAADTAMYAAKRAGRDQVKLYKERMA